MKGYQIFLHSVKQVFGNFGAAVRISGLLFLVQVFATLFFGRAAVMPGMQDAMAMPRGGMLLLLAVTLVTSLWIAVAWHRFILRVEEPQAILPAFHGQRMLAYLGYSLLLIIIAAIPALVFSFLGAMMVNVLGNNIVTSLFAMLIVLVPVLLITLRLCPVLPAAALGEPLGLRGAWDATGGTTVDFLILAVVATVASFAVDLPMFLFMGAMPLAMGWALVTAWLKMMVSASILTTIYGHYVERRSLAA
ncbi:MAG TPA: hypothetical protein PLI43_20485 [Albidovulum sp.]|uniref:hypothetical protein n=1 Tax=Albidovulum sp. TaxID=1872424 RepID=UPI002CE8B3EE|nr:hypothetical protein [Albidovulum sp.]